MLGFMEYVQSTWYATTGWDPDNSYGALTATARSLLEFTTPVGLALHCSSLPSRSFANSYSLGNAGAVDGSLAYLYSSRPLLLLRPGQELDGQGKPSVGAKSGNGATTLESLETLPSRSPDIPLRSLIQGYRDLADLRDPGDARDWELWQGGRRIDVRDTVLYGRLYLPQTRLEALYLRRLSPTAQLKIACVSSSQMRNGGSMLFTLQRDLGKTSMEYLYSTDGGLIGIRGLYNFGPDTRAEFLNSSSQTSTEATLQRDIGTQTQSSPPPPNGRFSAGAELYYGALNKTGGMSIGCRFATLPRHRGFPYTMTLTLNPLMGNLSSTYAVRAGPSLSLATRFDFNVYSYESEYQVGFELWKKKRELELDDDDDSAAQSESVRWAVDKLKESERRGWITERTREVAGKMIGGLEAEDASSMLDGSGGAGSANGNGNGNDNAQDAMQPLRDDDTAGVLKARVNQQGVLGVLWEGRVKQLLYTFGLNVDFRQREQIFRGVGIEFRYSS